MRQMMQKGWMRKWVWVWGAGVVLGTVLGMPGAWAQMPDGPAAPVITEQGTPWSDRVNDPDTGTFQAGYDYDYGDPTPAEQAHLEEINRARMDPMAEAARFGISLFEGVPAGEISGNPVQPVVFNSKLITAARLHSQDMIANDYFSHYALDGTDPFQRMQDAGYTYSTAGENLAFRGSTGYMEEVATVIKQHEDLFVDENYPDRGHRVNMLSPGFKEVGVGVAFGDYQGYAYSYMLTCDFGAAQSYSGLFLLGVVYDDQDGDQFYDAGEGLSNVTIAVAGAGTTTTATAGGYGIPVSAGTYTVTATRSDGTTAQKEVTVTSENRKVDFPASDFGSSGSSDPPVTDPTSSQPIGADPGVHTVAVTATQALTLVVNLTNAAGITPSYQWIWFTVTEGSQTSPIIALTPYGWTAWTSGTTLASLAYSPGTGTTFPLGDTTMATLGLGPGDRLTYGYAYAVGSVNNLVVENMVTLVVQ